MSVLVMDGDINELWTFNGDNRCGWMIDVDDVVVVVVVVVGGAGDDDLFERFS